MLLRDGRNQLHDLGARRVFQPSMIKAIVGYTDSPGGWTGSDHHRIFATQPERKEPTIPTHTFICESCGISATRYVAARFCSDRCRNREGQRRARAKA